MKCLNCDSKKVFKTSEDSWLCMDCRFFHEISCQESGKLSWWLWKREYKRMKDKVGEQ